MLKLLRRIVQESSLATDLVALMSLLTTEVRLALIADACTFYLVDEAKAQFVLAATDGLQVDELGKHRFNFSDGIIGLVALREEAINLSDMHTFDHFLQSHAIDEKNLHGYLAVPMIYQADLLGVLVVQRQLAQEFTEEEEAFLVTLCTQISPVMSDLIHHTDIKHLYSTNKRKTNRRMLEGIPASSGVAIGRTVVLFPPADFESVVERQAEDIAAETLAFATALESARVEIQDLQHRMKSDLSMAEHVLFDAYLRILDSRSLIDEVKAEIASGIWAQSALKRVVMKHSLRFAALEDEYLQERATDFRDLGQRILSYLQENEREVPQFDKPKILISEEITAAMLMEVPVGKLLGIVSEKGSSNSHVAILARALGIPAVTGISGLPLQELNDKELVIDGYNGHVFVSPKPQIKKEYKAFIIEENELDAKLQESRDAPAETTDGHKIDLLVNTGLSIDSSLSFRVGAGGVGLYRTEIPFMMHDHFPSEEYQTIMYKQLLNVFAPLPVVMRTLDIGGDKTLPYFPVEEDNPFLGWRGIRISLDHPELFLIQVRAMLMASIDLNNLSILLPMVSTIGEVESAKSLIHQAYKEVEADGHAVQMPKIGIMVEVPAAVFQAYELAKRVDFISVGSNDLIQYMLAVDRNNPRVVDLYDGLHPAVLRALYQVVVEANKANRPVSICGELASDPAAVIILLAMGYSSLSMNARSLLRVKWIIRTFSYKDAKRILKEVLQMDDAKEVRNHMETELEEAGLGGLIRAGA
jgi:phosphotransferase system enzyme I (PtsP)